MSRGKMLRAAASSGLGILQEVDLLSSHLDQRADYNIAVRLRESKIVDRSPWNDAATDEFCRQLL